MGAVKMEKSSGAVSSFRKGFILFGEYLKHFGLFSTTAVALLACALKGYLQLEASFAVDRLTKSLAYDMQ